MSTSLMHSTGAALPLASHGGGGGGHRAAAPENPLLMLHRYLRGRYPVALALAVIFAVPGAIVGYAAVKPTYSSTGIVRVAPTLPHLVYESADSRVPPMFDSFVSTEATTISSRRVLELALENEQLRSAGWPGGTDGLGRLIKNTKVNNRRGSELITVQVEHTEPRLAQFAVNAVLDAYETVREENSLSSAGSREQALRAIERDRSQQIDSIRRQIDALARPYGTDDLDQLYSARSADVMRLDSLIAELEIRLASMRSSELAATDLAAAAGAPEAGEVIEREISPEVELERLVAHDRELGGLVQNRRRLQTRIEAQTGHLGPEHREMGRLRREREALDLLIAERVTFLKENDLVPAAALAGAGEVAGLEGSSFAELQERLSRYSQLRQREDAERLQIGQARLSIKERQEKLAEHRRVHDDTVRILQQMEVENPFRLTNAAVGRISVAQRGDFPMAPAKDRRLPLAAFGGMAGVGLGVGLVVLLTLMQGGYRYIEDVERIEGAGALLGTVPDLRDGGPEHAALAALSVHHLRNMLQMNAPATAGGAVYTVSSAMAGDGKTSLSLSLAMSFAAMGNRTLLIDADFIGQGLSRQLSLSSSAGLCQALKADSLNGEVHATRVTNLWAIPVGFAPPTGTSPPGTAPAGKSDLAHTTMQPEHIAQGDLRRVLDMAREQFDTVIVDTGPILGSLEANLVAPMSDRVVLVVSRGQGTRAVRSALERLSRLGATCGGLVFNRAHLTDFDRSISAVSMSGRSLRESISTQRPEASSGAKALLDAVSTAGVESPSQQSAPATRS